MDLTASRRDVDLYALPEAFAAGSDRGPLPRPTRAPTSITAVSR